MGELIQLPIERPDRLTTRRKFAQEAQTEQGLADATVAEIDCRVVLRTEQAQYVDLVGPLRQHGHSG